MYTTLGTSIDYLPICPYSSPFYEHAYFIDTLLVSQIENTIDYWNFTMDSPCEMVTIVPDANKN